MCRPAHAIYLAARSWTGNLPDRPNLCLSMPRLENPLRPGCADWQRQCRLKNWAICEATLLSSGVCLKVSGRKKRAELKEAGFEQEIEYLERNGELSWTKINHLYAKGGVLALLRAPTPEALDAFAQISDADISDGIVALIERQHRMSESKKPEDCAEAKR